MFKTIRPTDTADCEIRAVIRFFNVKNVKLTEIDQLVKNVDGE